MKMKTMIAAVQVAAQCSKRATRNTTTTVEAAQAMSAELVTTMEEANEMLAKVEAGKAVTEATVASDAAAMDEAVPVLEAEATANEAVAEAEATTDEATGAAITVVQKGKDDNETDELLLSSGMEDIKLTVNISAVIVGISPTLVMGRGLNQLKVGESLTSWASFWSVARLPLGVCPIGPTLLVLGYQSCQVIAMAF